VGFTPASGEPVRLSGNWIKHLPERLHQQLAQINQNLIAQGVTRIQLTNLSWGPITNNGTTAIATSKVTWVTTFGRPTTRRPSELGSHATYRTHAESRRVAYPRGFRPEATSDEMALQR
jgi:hypothetical protein